MGRWCARRSISASFALATYFYALVAAPWLHAAHHARFGADHVHDANGTHALAPELASAHEDFHADLAALGLDEVAAAGTLEVDCRLAVYTLAECVEPHHAPRFGDALVAHHRHAPPTPDPLHGRGALEHLGESLLCPSPAMLPPPAKPVDRVALPLVTAPRESIPARAPLARGPPA
jgi:hypothetical protein